MICSDRKWFLVTWRSKTYKVPASRWIKLSWAKYWHSKWGSHKGKYFISPWAPVRCLTEATHRTRLFIFPATVFGDPHVYTFDNQAYTFNGLGEYVLVRANTPRVKLDVQGRFEQVRNIAPAQHGHGLVVGQGQPLWHRVRHPALLCCRQGQHLCHSGG